MNSSEDRSLEDHAAEQEAYLREEIIGAVFNGITNKRLREATREIIAPLVKLAEVDEQLKVAALSPRPTSMHPDEMEHDRQDIRESLASLIESGALTLNARGGYELTNAPPEPNTAEAIKHAGRILKGWPDEAKAKILAVLRGA